jgi:hypothetical protein
MRHPLLRALPVAAAILLALLLGPLLARPARADVMVAGTKPIDVTFEVQGTAAFPGYVFVVYPYLRGGLWGAASVLNRDPDFPFTNYQVLRDGERYPMPKFGGGRIYAIERKGLTVEETTLAADQGFYRKAGSKLTVIREFDALKDAAKEEFIANDPRVRGSNAQIQLPLAVTVDRPFTSTHDVFRVAAVDDRRAHVAGVKVVLGEKDGHTTEVPYEGDRRPAAAGGEDDYGAEPLEPLRVNVKLVNPGEVGLRAAPAPAPASPAPVVGGALLALVGAVVFLVKTRGA